MKTQLSPKETVVVIIKKDDKNIKIYSKKD